MRRAEHGGFHRDGTAVARAGPLNIRRQQSYGCVVCRQINNILHGKSQRIGTEVWIDPGCFAGGENSAQYIAGQVEVEQAVIPYSITLNVNSN